jgi:hypothetical protein
MERGRRREGGERWEERLQEQVQKEKEVDEGKGKGQVAKMKKGKKIGEDKVKKKFFAQLAVLGLWGHFAASSFFGS